MRQLLPISLLALLACDARRDRVGGSARERTDTPASSIAAESSAATGSREIYIDSVTPGNPLVVYGRARTFENTVQVRARDEHGEIITETFDTSVGDMGRHNPYVARVWLVRDPGAHVTVEAFEYSAEDGSERSLTATRASLAGARSTLTLMWPTSDCTRTEPFIREAPRAVAVARLLVEALVAGPTAEEKAAGASAPFPSGSRVNSVVLRDGEITVDFNERLQNVGGSCAVQAIRTSVTQTLMRLSAVKRVAITAAGNSELALQP